MRFDFDKKRLCISLWQHSGLICFLPSWFGVEERNELVASFHFPAVSMSEERSTSFRSMDDHPQHSPPEASSALAGAAPRSPGSGSTQAPSPNRQRVASLPFTATSPTWAPSQPSPQSGSQSLSSTSIAVNLSKVTDYFTGTLSSVADEEVSSYSKAEAALMQHVNEKAMRDGVTVHDLVAFVRGQFREMRRSADTRHMSLSNSLEELRFLQSVLTRDDRVGASAIPAPPQPAVLGSQHALSNSFATLNGQTQPQQHSPLATPGSLIAGSPQSSHAHSPVDNYSPASRYSRHGSFSLMRHGSFSRKRSDGVDVLVLSGEARGVVEEGSMSHQ